MDDPKQPEPQNENKQERRSFAGNVLKLTSGSVVGQGVVLLSAPVLTRYFGLTNWGVFAIYTSLQGLLMMIVCLRYEVAIVLPAEDSEAASVFALSVSLVLLTSALVAGVVTIFGGQIASLFNAPDLAAYMWLLPTGLLIHGTYQAVIRWNMRRKAFGRIAVAGTFSPVVMSLLSLGAGLTGFAHFSSLIGAKILGSFTALMILTCSMKAVDFRLLFQGLRLNRLREVAARYKKFPQFLTWAGFFRRGTDSLPVLLFSTFFTTAIVGAYSLGYRVLHTPLILLGTSLAKVFFVEASEGKESAERLEKLIVNVVKGLSVLSLPWFILLAASGEPVFAFVFGSEWALAGLYAQILTPWLYVTFLTQSLNSVTSVMERQEIDLVFKVCSFVVVAIALTVGGLMENALLAVILLSVTGSLLRAWWLFWLLRIAGVEATAVLGKLVRGFPWSVWLLLPAAIAINYQPLLAAAASLVVLIYYHLQLVRNYGIRVPGGLMSRFSGQRQEKS